VFVIVIVDINYKNMSWLEAVTGLGNSEEAYPRWGEIVERHCPFQKCIVFQAIMVVKLGSRNVWYKRTSEDRT
jgi:hypothetical protein